MKLKNRDAIDDMRKELLDQDPSSFTSYQLEGIAGRLDDIANFFEENPERWIAGQEFLAADGVPNKVNKVCAIGALRNAKRVGLKWTPTAKQISRAKADRIIDFVIGMNDSMQSPEDVVEGLRYAASAFRFASQGDLWPWAVKRAFAKNSHLLQVQVQRALKKAPKTLLWSDAYYGLPENQQTALRIAAFK